ncbi:MAG: hypothetical protein CME65_09285 [Halobacteriovoraceae bacterium]|nr:hypothetical protein [Halobacteriovoraceae bacterium]|tara:strand:+ start:17334 stop:18716 length:1383 start_codon:yes stop_codon:yes gene_type:complete
MFKKILGNSHGVTLIETVAAMGISVVLAAGVMRLNQNASKGMARITAKSNLLDFKNDMRRKLGQLDGAGSPLCTSALNTAFGVDATGNETAASLTIGGTVITAGQPLPTAEAIRVESITRSAFVSSAGATQGRCDIVLELTNERDGQIGSYNMTIPISCTVNNTTDNEVVRCSSADGIGNEGLGELMTDGSARDHMIFDTAGADFMTIGPNPDMNSTTGALTIVTSGSNSSTIVGSRNALDLEYNDAILWGPNLDGTDFVGIYGDLDAGKGRLNLDAEIVRIENPVTSSETTLDVEGQINATTVYSSAYYYSSDKNFKKEINDLGIDGSVSDKLENIRGVTYFMRKDEFPEMGFSDRKQIGLIAQEVEEVFPELVQANPISGYKSVAYGNFVAILIEAFKEQREEIRENREMLAYLQGQANMKDYEQDARIEALERENEMLRDELDELRRKVDMILYKEE